MKKAGHDRNAPSESLSDTEQNFLKRYSLKKITVPKEKLRDIVNLRVVQNGECSKEWQSPQYEIPKETTKRSERLEYRDLSKVMRSNVPWMLGTGGASKNLSGQRLVSLVEVTDEDCNSKNQRLEAGVEAGFKKQDSIKGSVDVGEILSKGMEICLTAAGRNLRKSASPMHYGCDNMNICKSELRLESVEDMENFADLEIEIKAPKAGCKIGSEYKVSTTANLKDMAWIEKRLDRVQQLLMTLEDLRLQSGCEKCQGKDMSPDQQTDDNVNDNKSTGGRRAVGDEASPTDIMLETKICKCDLELIEKEMRDLYCYLKELVKKQTSAVEKSQYEIIMCRLQEICECFSKFARKLLENSKSTAPPVRLENKRGSQVIKSLQATQDVPTILAIQAAQAAQNIKNFLPTPVETIKPLGDFDISYNAKCCCNAAKRQEDCVAAGSMFLDPPLAWCAQIKQDEELNNCTKTVFMPYFYYNPTTGECKFTKEEDGPVNCNCVHAPNSAQPCCCWTCERLCNDGLKKNTPLNLNEMLLQISEIEGKTKDKSTEKSQKNDKAKEEKGEKKNEKENKSNSTKNDKPPVPLRGQELAKHHCLGSRSVKKVLMQESSAADCAAIMNDEMKSPAWLLENAESTRPEELGNDTFTSCTCRSERSGPKTSSTTKISSQDSETTVKTAIRIDIPKTKQETPKRALEMSNQQPQTKPKQVFSTSGDKEPSSKTKEDYASKTNQVAASRSSHVSVKLTISDSSKNIQQAVSSDGAVKPLAQSVTFKSEPPREQYKETAEKPTESVGKKLKDVCKVLCEHSLRKLSDSCKNLYENFSDPNKQKSEIPCETLCDLCTNTGDGTTESDPNEQVEDKEPAQEVKAPTQQPRADCAEILKNYEIYKNYEKTELNPNKTRRAGSIDKPVHKSPYSFPCKRTAFPTKPCTCSNQDSQQTTVPISDQNFDSVETSKNACSGDAPQRANDECCCCCCEGVPPVEVALGSIIQNRVRSRQRGSVYLKFTMSPNNLFHIQMATINNEFLGCFYATEAAVLEARRSNGFDGCITLSVMEPSNSPSQINSLVDHAFMVVQQDRKN